MHSQTLDPGLHSGVARTFGLFFLFQSLASLLSALSSQLYPSYLSQWTSLLSAASIAFAAFMCVPACLEVALPESPSGKRPAFIAAVSCLAICLFFLPGPFPARLDLPYVPRIFARKLLGAIAGGALVLAAASAVRMARGMKGANGALILAVALGVIASAGIVWTVLEPVCRMTGREPVLPEGCPMPGGFDHNVLAAVALMVADALAAEGVLRLMQAGDGVMGYTSIQV